MKSGYNNFGGAYSSGTKSKAMMAKTGGMSQANYGTTRPTVSKSVNKKFMPLRDQGKLILNANPKSQNPLNSKFSYS
jgi:hypothetical protein